MPIIFTDVLQPPAGVSIPLLKASDMRGGFVSVNTKADLDRFKLSAIKVGMLVNVNEDNAIYECKSLEISYDDDWNEIVTPVFEKFFVAAKEAGEGEDAAASRYRRRTKKVSFSYLRENAVVNVPVDMECKSFIVTSLKISEDRKIRFSIYGTLARTDLNPYTFESRKRSFDTHQTELRNGSIFQYRKFNTCINSETAKANQTKFIFQCLSLERGLYTMSKGLSWAEVEAEITYIPLEAP